MRKLFVMALAAVLALTMAAGVAQAKGKKPGTLGLGLPRLHGLYAFKPQHLLSV